MTIEQQVCSLKLAKRLKESGIRQKSIVLWQHFHGWGEHADKWEVRHYSDFRPSISNGEDVCAAFPLSELIEALGTNMDDAFLLVRRGDEWMASHSSGSSNQTDQVGSTPEEAVAKLLLSLMELKKL